MIRNLFSPQIDSVNYFKRFAEYVKQHEKLIVITTIILAIAFSAICLQMQDHIFNKAWDFLKERIKPIVVSEEFQAALYTTTLFAVLGSALYLSTGLRKKSETIDLFDVTSLADAKDRDERPFYAKPRGELGEKAQQDFWNQENFKPQEIFPNEDPSI